MSTFVAGAIGSLITIAVALLARLAAIPRQIRSNDRRAREIDDELDSWIADRTVALRRELRQDRANLNRRGLVESGEYGYMLGVTKERALFDWRERERQARSAVGAIYDREDLLHQAWRRVASHSRHELKTPGLARPLLEIWRIPPVSPRSRQRAEEGHPIDDPTSRSLQHALRDASTDPDQFQ